ncbi:hypothetical protein ANO11243_096410 [Dothideomycetidae sp. 11243]|nr:hypothetical protein ANO11243_096410 [fungal sp. No.11243]
MVKALSFKGDPKPKKRKRRAASPSAPTNAPATNDNADEDEEDTSWTNASAPSDVSGPVLLIFLPASTSPSKEHEGEEDQEVKCVASDLHGSIYASPISGDASTAEPADVRQVWVASRVAGSETLSFKSAGSRYLSASASGALSATREARGVDEGFTLLASSNGEFKLRSAHGGCISLSVKGDKITTGEDEAEGTQMAVRMQSRFKPVLAKAKADRTYAKISRSQMEKDAGRPLDDDEAVRLKRARKEGTYHEEMLGVRAKGKHDKFA